MPVCHNIFIKTLSLGLNSNGVLT